MLYIEKAELLNIIESSASMRGSCACRPSHALIFKKSGESTYQFSNRCYTLSAGEAMFIPQGECYTYGKSSQVDSLCIIINFHGQISNPQPAVYPLADFLDFDHLCHQLHKASLGDSSVDRYRLYRLFYQALETICETHRTGYLQGKSSLLLEPAIAYLQEHLFDPALKIGKLHTFCNISDTYFRKLFITRFGVSPKQYVLRKRLQKAKALLDHGEYHSISRVAALCGFEDPLYFSKLFHQRYGYPPSKAYL